MSHFTSIKTQIKDKEVIISQDGNPIARVVPIADKSLPRIPGLDKGKVVISEDFDAPLPDDILNSFTNPVDFDEYESFA